MWISDVPNYRDVVHLEISNRFDFFYGSHLPQHSLATDYFKLLAATFIWMLQFLLLSDYSVDSQLHSSCVFALSWLLSFKLSFSTALQISISTSQSSPRKGKTNVIFIRVLHFKVKWQNTTLWAILIIIKLTLLHIHIIKIS